MMSSFKKVSVGLAALVLTMMPLSACGNTAASPTPTATNTQSPDQLKDSAAPSEKANPDPSKVERNDRGNIIKHAGDKAMILTDNNELTVQATWTVDSIEYDVKCTEEYAKPAENGHYVVFNVTAETTKNLENTLLIGNANLWKFVSSDGTIYNGNVGDDNTFSCLAKKERFPYQLGAAQKAKGKIVFDVPSYNGSLIYSEYGTGSDGWEYPLRSA